MADEKCNTSMPSPEMFSAWKGWVHLKNLSYFGLNPPTPPKKYIYIITYIYIYVCIYIYVIPGFAKKTYGIEYVVSSSA